MSHEPHEEAEEASHHSKDPFDKRIAMTMVVVAALLAVIKVAGHQAHNERIAHLVTSVDDWAYFQSKKNRMYLYESQADLLQNLGARSTTPAGVDRDPFDVVADAHKEAEHQQDAPKKNKDHEPPKQPSREELVKEHGLTPSAADRVVWWRKQAKDYRKETDDLLKKANDAEKASHTSHAQARWYDLGELAVELALVLCSVAILIRKPGFWYLGIVVCAIGVALALVGVFATGHHAEHTETPSANLHSSPVLDHIATTRSTAGTAIPARPV
jgi:Domain of unknown function (DUF4337)